MPTHHACASQRISHWSRTLLELKGTLGNANLVQNVPFGNVHLPRIISARWIPKLFEEVQGAISMDLFHTTFASLVVCLAC